jgi:alcohol dehydrogenase
MKALLLEAPLRWRQVNLDEPSPPGPGDALVRVHRVGICGTDISGYLGKMPFFNYPRIPGHELGVEVVQVGPGVSNVGPGNRCSVEPYLNCGHCFACERGHSNCCENLQVLGVHCDGGLRPYFTVPARNLHVARGLTFEQLALVETLAIGCHAVNRSAVKPGDNLLVIGAGPIGLSVIEFARLAGARTIVMDLNEQRLAFVREGMKVPDTIHARSDGSELKAFTELTAGNLGQVVVDATGSHQSMSQAYNFVGFTGRLVFLGISTQEISFAQPLMHRREMTFLASRNAVPADFTRIIGLIEAGRIDTRPWVTHRPAFEELAQVFPSYTRPETGVIKAIVDVRE